MGITGIIEGGLDITSSALRVAEAILKKMPTHNQEEAEKARDLRLAYEKELKADIPLRDDNRVCDLRDKSRVFMDSLATILDGVKEIKLK